MASYDVGIRYQMYHGLGLLLLGLNANKIKQSLNAVYWLLLLGTLFFSGSIYFLSLQDILSVKLNFLGPVTPLGGVFMIAGWILLIIKMTKINGGND